MAGPLCITYLVLLYWVGKILIEVCNWACSQLLDSGEIVTACDDDLQSYLGEPVKGEQVLNWKVLLSLGVCISFPVHYISLGMGLQVFYCMVVHTTQFNTCIFKCKITQFTDSMIKTCLFKRKITLFMDSMINTCLSSARSLGSWIPWSTLVFSSARSMSSRLPNIMIG